MERNKETLKRGQNESETGLNRSVFYCCEKYVNKKNHTNHH